MKNPYQKKKAVISRTKSVNAALELVSKSEIGSAVLEIPFGKRVFFLGRYNSDIELLNDDESFGFKYDNNTHKVRVYFKPRPDLDISFMTVHKSKGLEADYSVILNSRGIKRGFPSTVNYAPVLRAVVNNDDEYPNAEERRLFYVALTRARIKTWIVTEEYDVSCFIDELKQIMRNYCSVSEFAAESDFKPEPERPVCPGCPQCGGRLVIRQGKYGKFYGCENYIRGCKYISRLEDIKNIYKEND